jgi:hypothetical protein
MGVQHEQVSTYRAGSKKIWTRALNSPARSKPSTRCRPRARYCIYATHLSTEELKVGRMRCFEGVFSADELRKVPDTASVMVWAFARC